MKKTNFLKFLLGSFLMLLVFSPAESQSLTLKTAAARYWFGRTTPAVVPSGFYKQRDIWVDTVLNKSYFNNGTVWVPDSITKRLYSGIQGVPGVAGATGATGPAGSAASVTVGSTVTLSPGSSATVTNVGTSAAAILQFGIPKGDKGDTGGGGGGGSGTFINAYLYDDMGRIVVQGYNATTTLAGAGISDTIYDGITVTGSDQVDWANLQYAVYLAKLSGKPIHTFGTFKGINKAIVIDKDHYNLVIEGNYSAFYTSTASAIYMWDRVNPDNTVMCGVPGTGEDWKCMISNTRWSIRNMIVNLQGANGGFDTQMQNGSVFENILIQQGRLGFNCNFTINTWFKNIKVFTPTEGGIFVDNGAFPGATPAGSGSVSNRFDDFHLISFGTCDYGIKLRYCESTIINKPIIEGYLVKKGIWMDGDGNGNFREIFINNIYCESGSSSGPYTGVGNGQAIVYARMLSGKIVINGAKSIYSAVLLDVGAQGGTIDVTVRDVSWWPNIGGKMFYTLDAGATIRYQFNGWNWWYFPANITSLFAGRAITYGCIVNNGSQPTWSVCVN